MSSTACSALNISLRNKLRQKIRAKEASRRSSKYEERAYHSLTIAAGLRTKKSRKNHDVDFENAKPHKQQSELMTPSALHDLALVIHNSVQMLAHKHATMDIDLDRYSDDFSDILPSEKHIATVVPGDDTPVERSQNKSNLMEQTTEETVDEEPLQPAAVPDPEVEVIDNGRDSSGLNVSTAGVHEEDSVKGKTGSGATQGDVMQSNVSAVEKKSTRPDSEMQRNSGNGCMESEGIPPPTLLQDECPNKLAEDGILQGVAMGVGVGVEDEKNDRVTAAVEDGYASQGRFKNSSDSKPESKATPHSIKAGDGGGEAPVEFPDLVDFGAPTNASSSTSSKPIDHTAETTNVQCVADCGIEQAISDSNEESVDVSLGKSFLHAQMDFMKSQPSSWLEPIDEQNPGMGEDRKSYVASPVSADSCCMGSGSTGSLSPGGAHSGKGDKGQNVEKKAKRNRGKQRYDVRKLKDAPGVPGHSHSRGQDDRKPNSALEKLQRNAQPRKRSGGHRKSKLKSSFRGSKKTKTTLVLSCMEDILMGDNPFIILHFRLSSRGAQDTQADKKRLRGNQGSASFQECNGWEQWQEGCGDNWGSNDSLELCSKEGFHLY